MTDMTDDLTPQELEELKRLESVMMVAPWSRSGIRRKIGGEDCLQILGPDDAAYFFAPIGRTDEDHRNALNDMDGIVAARNALPRLIAMVERLQEWQGSASILMDAAQVQLRQRDMTTDEMRTAEWLRNLSAQNLGENYIGPLAELSDLRRQLAERDVEIERLKKSINVLKNTIEMERLR